MIPSSAVPSTPSTSLKYLACFSAGIPKSAPISTHALSNSAAVTCPLPSASPVVVKAFNSCRLIPSLPLSSKKSKMGSKSTPVEVRRAALAPATANKTKIRVCIILIFRRGKQKRDTQKTRKEKFGDRRGSEKEFV